jgi:hypothetical protein
LAFQESKKDGGMPLDVSGIGRFRAVLGFKGAESGNTWKDFGLFYRNKQLAYIWERKRAE